MSEFLLRSFAEASGRKSRLCVEQLDAAHSYVAAPSRVAVRVDAHAVTPYTHEDPAHFERKMADEVEAPAAAAIRAVIESDAEEVPGELRPILSRFLALHVFRHPVISATVQRDVEREQSVNLTAPDAHEGALKDIMVEAMSSPTGKDPGPAVRVLEQLAWAAVRFDSEALVIGDRLACTSGLAPQGAWASVSRAASYGVVGLDRCERVTVPLSPRVGLILTRGAVAPQLSAREFNRTTVRNGRLFVAYDPSWPEREPEEHRWVAQEVTAQRVAITNQFRQVHGEPSSSIPL
ncbi:DUF4238 domain-containing protein [Rathayibacter tritici]|uniref:DUF4238 domain-containing protein n=1 Tax=Rathayibacter tritici TaxID=33888 RepID=UPI0015E4069F|nr:DUF4238 domain-containing protein [Rathayibacter tritici]